MALTESAFVLWTPVEPRSCRLFLVDFLVRMWRLNACERLMLPLPRTRKRFFAPLLVFILGMMLLAAFLFAAHRGALRGRGFLRLGFLGWRLTGFGLVRVMPCFGCRLLRGQQHHHLPALQPRKLFYDAIRLEVAANTLQQAHAEFLVRHLAPAEPQRHLRLVALAEKADQVAHLDLVVAFVGPGPELHFLDLDLLELELRLVRPLGLPVFELAEIHDPAYRRCRERRDLDQIELCRFRARHRIRDRHDAELLTVCTYQANLRSGDLAVDSLRFFQGYCVLLCSMKDRPCLASDPPGGAGSAPGCLGLEAGGEGFQGHRPKIFPGARTHGHVFSLHFLVAQDHLVRQLLQAMFSNFIGYLFVAQIRDGAISSLAQRRLHFARVRR